MKRIVTHSEPDADAVASAWLAARFLFPGEDVEVAFVPYFAPGQPAPASDCLVDVGHAHDPGRLAFDHKPPGGDRNATCSTSLVWEYLRARGVPVGHLEALVRVVHEGDRNPPAKPSPGLAASRADGFHARLKQARGRGVSDDELFREMSAWLNDHAASEGRRMKS